MLHRQTRGSVRFLFKFVDGLDPRTITIKGRVNWLRMDVEDSLVKSNGSVSIAVDASGIKVRDGGGWIRLV